ncbi:hypothetical protein [Companilactobacillus jidongensis]|uniref:hypothetical protein n=1 Tax=Companilactobacillus jidongensis TaxID=2486006 RepID=UPI000F774195|nr:hypothetical protein [Companilactobacillus jidongensis]
MNHKGGITFLGMLFVVFMGIIFLFNSTQTNVKAWSSIDGDVINSAPYGLSLDNYFDYPATYTTGEANSARTSKPSNNPTTDVVLLTDGKGETSSVWSNGDNYIDTSKKQTLSMWLYFGRNSDPKGAADGMAFVLQNDPLGTKAISKLNNKVNKGESLGVWGSDGSKLVTNNDAPIKTDSTTPIQLQAIQNSWALEFDTFTNNGSSKDDTVNGGKVSNISTNAHNTNASLPNAGDAFDWLPYSGDNTFIRGSHIAWNYPARLTSYKQISNTPPKYNEGTGLFHFGAGTTGNSIMALYHNFGTDSGYNGNNVDFTYNSSKPPIESWKHVTITYIPPTAADPNNATIHYAYNDKDTSGKIIKKHIDNTYAEGTAKVDMSAFGSIADNSLRYGFTGSTGSDTDTTNAVIFETMPSLVEAEVNSYAVDKDTHARVGSDTSIMDEDAQAMSETTKVHPGDNIGLNYMMQYDSGKQPSKNVVATVDVPDNLTINNDDGNIGTVYYSGIDNSNEKATTKEVAINASSISSDSKSVSLNIDDMGVTDTSEINWKTARVELNTTANQLTSDTSLKVPAGHASFEGTNYKGDTEIPTFDIVKPADVLVLTKTSGDGTYSSTTKEIDLNGSIKYGTSTADVDKIATWYTYTIDNQSPVTTQDTLSDSGNFSIPITGLTDGVHTITVKASTKLTNDTISSNVLTYTVDVQDMIITNKAQVYDESQSRYITDGDNVQEGDKLQYQYNINYDSGTKYLRGLALQSSQPDNLTIRSAYRNVKADVTYTAFNGETTTHSQDDIGVTPYKYNFEYDLGNTGADILENVRLKSFKLVYYMTANNVDTETVVDSTTATVSNDEYSGSMDTPSFTIRNAEYKPHLEATDGTDIQSVATNDDFTLKGLVTYFTNDDAHTKTDFKNSEMTAFARVDGSASNDAGFEKVGSLSDSDNAGVMTILRNASSLGNGVHNLYVKVTDKYGNVSNTVAYEIRVGDKVLAVTPKDRVRTVEDGLPVKLEGTYNHTDGSALEGDQITIQYQIHSENTSVDQEKQSVIYSTGYQSGDITRKFSFDVVPVGYNRPGTAISHDDWVDRIQNGQPSSSGNVLPIGLRIGQNTVDVVLTDTAGHSVRTSYTINVPEDNLNLSLDNTDLTVISKLATANFASTLKYDGSFNVTSTGQSATPMLIYVTNPDNNNVVAISLDPVDSQSTADFTNELNRSMLENLKLSNDSIETGVGKKYPLEFFAEDLYGRKSNTVEGTVQWVSKSVTLESNTDYRFNPVNKSAEHRIVKRNGQWTLGVDSVQSAWNLTASAGSMTTKDIAGNITTLPGNLIFIDKGNNLFSMDSNTQIASNDDLDSENVNIANSWGDDDGILLNLTGEPVAGTYTTKIDWTLASTL